MNVPWKLVPTLDELILDTNKPLCFDIETDGLYGPIRLAQFFQEGQDTVQIVEKPEPFTLALYLSKYNFWAHSAHYEVSTIQEQSTTRWIPERFEDSLLAARLALPTLLDYDLESLLTGVLGYDPYDKQGLDKKVLQKSDWGAPVLSHKQYAYAATDVYFMPQLIAVVSPALESQSYKLDMHTLRYCLDFQWNGMPIDQNRINERYEANEIEIAKAALPVNVNSWQQVRPYIGEDESDDLALARFAHAGNERAFNVRRIRKITKQNSFLKKFSVERVMGFFKPYARSGRLTSNRQNQQQHPRELKDCFGVEEGWIIYADYAQLELRTIAAITNCLLMVEKFKEGVDLHDFTAEMIFGSGFTKHQRQLTKTANFNFLYGGGIGTFISILQKQADVFLEEREGYSLRKRWRNLWREIYHWQQKGIDAWQKGKTWSTPLGRIYKGKMMTDQLNIQNQGAGAEVAKLALHYMYPKLEDGVQLLNFIHDSYILWSPDLEQAKRTSKLLADKMQEAWYEMSKLFPVKDLPMPVNVRIGKNWGDIENGKFEWELNQ
jgi:DNA polymerase I-like protein with 3'-5' exonuclease and polymerase domains